MSEANGPTEVPCQVLLDEPTEGSFLKSFSRSCRLEKVFGKSNLHGKGRGDSCSCGNRDRGFSRHGGSSVGTQGAFRLPVPVPCVVSRPCSQVLRPFKTENTNKIVGKANVGK